MLSGPAAASWGVSTRRGGARSTITLDVGGTSADICVAPAGQARMKHLLDSSIDGYPVMVPMIDIETIGAGGGWIATVEEGQIIKVGPESAGADPGARRLRPRGPDATVTDANVVLGRLRPEASSAAACRSIATCPSARSRPTWPSRWAYRSRTPRSAVIAVTVHNMVNAIETNSVRKGYDPREFVLVAAGGAGPLHAVEIARIIGIPHVVVPPYPGVTAAAGLLASDVRYELVASAWQDLGELDQSRVESLYAELEAGVEEHLAGAGFTGESVLIERAADLPLRRPGLRAARDRAGRRRGRELGRGRARGLRGASRARVLRQVPRAERGGDRDPRHGHRAHAGASLAHPRCGHRRPGARPGRRGAGGVRHGRGQRARAHAHLHARSAAGGDVLPGPAIVEQIDSTTVIPPGASARIDEIGNLVLTVQEG